MKYKIFESRNRQKGFALILAIGFLAILSILGAVVMNVATRDLKDTRVTLPNQRVLQAAERSVEYALNEDMRVLLMAEPDDEIDLMVDQVSGVTHQSVIDLTGPGRILSGKIKTTFEPNLPPGLSSQVNSVNTPGRFFQVSVKTSPNNGTVGVFDSQYDTHIDANFLQVLPNPGGGNVVGSHGGTQL